MLVHTYDTIIDCDIVGPGHGKYILAEWMSLTKKYLSKLIVASKFPGKGLHENKMKVQTST